MKRRNLFGRLSVMALAAVALTTGGTAQAQLQITEIMSNPLSANDNAWEWVEVRNLGGAAVDLNGYLISRLNDEEFLTPGVSNVTATNTVIPAGSVAVLYDGQLTGAGDFNDGLFRTAWGLSPTVPLIAVNNFGLGLSNGDGTAIGFWADATAYGMDLSNADADPELEVTSLANAAFAIDYRTTNMFPSVPDGTSIRWSGNGSYQDGTQWVETTSGTTSVPATLSGNTNSPNDTASPGFFPGGAATGLVFTEIMYNPASDEPDWEWVEIFNNTGSTIDFSSGGGWVFDDNDNAALTEANVTSGIVPNGTGAVLFNAGSAGITLTDMQAAWDQGQDPNFIPVTSGMPDLAQSGDQLGLWSSLAAYGTRDFGTATATVTYDNEDVEGETGITGIWPNDDARGSIQINDIGADKTVGENWSLSVEGQGSNITANAVTGTLTIHPGGDLGTPGAFGITEPTDDADFDNDSDVDGNDFLIWQRGVGVGSDNATGDADGSGVVDGADLAVWRSQFDAAAAAAVGAIPEPASLLLVGLGLAASALAGRRRGAN